MQDDQLLRILNALAARSIVLECQVLALRRLLGKHGIIADREFDGMLHQAVNAYTEILNPEKSESERLADFLRTFEGPVQ